MKMNRWVYAIVGFVVMLCAGLVYAWTNISKTLKAEMMGAQGDSFANSDFAMVFTISIAAFCVGGIVGGFIVKKFNARISILLAIIFFPLGMFITSKSGLDTFGMLYLGYGLFVGLAAGFVYNAVLSTVTRWFQDMQGVISGILLMGFGIGGFLLGPIYSKIEIAYNNSWSDAFLTVGIAIAIVLILSIFFFMVPGDDYKTPAPRKIKVKKVNEEGIDVNPKGMMKRSSFWIYMIWNVLMTAAGLSIIPNARGFIENLGTGAGMETVIYVAGLISIFSGLGRIIFGFLFDKIGRKLSTSLCSLIFIIAIGVLMVAFNAGSLEITMVGFVLAGIAYGGIPSMNSAFVNTFYGNRNYAVNLPVVNTSLIVAALLGSYLAGWLLDIKGFIGILSAMLIFTVVAIITPFIIKKA